MENLRRPLVKFTQAGLAFGLLMLGLLCKPLMGGDVPHVEPAVRVTERGGTTGNKADNELDATGYDDIPWGDTWASDTIGPLKIFVLTRKLNPPENRVFVQYLEDGKWYDSIPSDARGFAVSDWKPSGPKLISVYRPFFNTEVPDADNFPWRLEGNLGREGGGEGGGKKVEPQFHWGAKITRPALPDDLCFVFGDQPKTGLVRIGDEDIPMLYVGLFVVPSQAIVDALANAGGGYIITKYTQEYNGETEVVYYGGKLTTEIFVGGEGHREIRTLDPDHTTYYPGANGTLLGGPHMTSDGRIALEYDVLINNSFGPGREIPGSISISVETKVFKGDPGETFGNAVSAVPGGDRDRSGSPDKNENQHKANAYFGIERENTPNPDRDTLWEGVPENLLKTAKCSVAVNDVHTQYISNGIQDPPEDINLRVNRPLGLGSGRFEKESTYLTKVAKFPE